MEDNTNQVAQESAPETKDINTFRYEKGYARGCSTGQHDWSAADAQISIGENGLTALKVRCMLCGTVGEIQAPLNVNDLIEKYSTDETVMNNQPQQIVQPVQPQPSQPTQPAVSKPVRPVVVNDNFWESIKRGV